MGSFVGCGEALDAFLSNFGGGGGDIVYQGEVYSPQRGRGYISGRLSGYSRSPLGVGALTAFQIDGTYQVTVHRPAAEGLQRAATIATALESYFVRGTTLVTGTGTRLQILSASAQPAQPAVDWITVPVVVSWLCSEP